MILRGDDIVEASLLKPAGDECGTFPTPEEEAIFLGEEVEPPEALESAASLPEHLEIPRSVEPIK